MLLRHYRSGMTMDTLSFDEVRSDDPAITGPDYIDVPADILPELKGANFWWQLLPPSGKLVFSCCTHPSKSWRPSELEGKSNTDGQLRGGKRDIERTEIQAEAASTTCRCRRHYR